MNIAAIISTTAVIAIAVLAVIAYPFIAIPLLVAILAAEVWQGAYDSESCRGSEQ